MERELSVSIDCHITGNWGDDQAMGTGDGTNCDHAEVMYRRVQTDEGVTWAEICQNCGHSIPITLDKIASRLGLAQQQ